jgi:hypothetical protein
MKGVIKRNGEVTLVKYNLLLKKPIITKMIIKMVLKMIF